MTSNANRVWVADRNPQSHGGDPNSCRGKGVKGLGGGTNGHNSKCPGVYKRSISRVHEGRDSPEGGAAGSVVIKGGEKANHII